MMWCPVVAPRKPPQAPRSSQEATPAGASEAGPSTPPPAKCSKRTEAEQAAEPTQPTRGKGKAKGKAAKAQPAPQPGRWVDRDCNAALNMQRIGESRWRPLELCYWPEQGKLPAKGKEYPGLGYKRLRDKPPKAQEQQQQQPAVAHSAQPLLSCPAVHTTLPADARQPPLPCSSLPTSPAAAAAGSQHSTGGSSGEAPGSEEGELSEEAEQTNRLTRWPGPGPPGHAVRRARLSHEHCAGTSPAHHHAVAQPKARKHRPQLPGPGSWPSTGSGHTYDMDGAVGLHSPAGRPLRLLEKATARLDANRVMLRRSGRAATSTRRARQRNRKVIKVPEGAVLRGCKKTKRKLRAHLQLRAEVHTQLRVIASLFVLRIFLTCLPASMESDSDYDSESDCESGPESQSDSESEPEPEPVRQPTPRLSSARLAALAPAVPSGPPVPLDCEDPVMQRQLKEFCEFYANPNFKAVYNQLQRRLVRPKQRRHPMLMLVFEDPSNQALLAKLQELGNINLIERFVKLYAKAARARLGWSGEEAQLFIKMACGYGIKAQSSEPQAVNLDKGHVADLVKEANKHLCLLGMKQQGSLQDTLPLPCRMRHAVHAYRWLEQWQQPPPYLCHGSRSAARGVGGIAETREYLFDPDTQIGVGFDPGVTQAVSAASEMWDLARWKLTKGQVKHASGLNIASRDTERWLAPIKPHLQHLAAASSAGTSLEANQKHITVTLATWDAVWEVYLDPEWAQQRLRLYGAQDRALEQFFKKTRLEEDMAEVSMKRHGHAKQLAVFFGAASIAKRSKRMEAGQAAEPTQPTKGKGKGEGKPAPQPGRWLDRDCNAALNMQRIGESKWRPLELCYWPEQGKLPAKGKEYPGLGYKRLRDKPPKAQEQQPAWHSSSMQQSESCHLRDLYSMKGVQPGAKRVRVDDHDVRISKAMSRILRHSPPPGAMDAQGWVPLPLLLQHLGRNVTAEQVRRVVDCNDKVQWIAAQLTVQWAAIQQDGYIKRMGRTHIHFATLPGHMRTNSWAQVLLRLDVQVLGCKGTGPGASLAAEQEQEQYSCQSGAPRKPTQAPGSSQAATQPAASEPGPSNPPPAKRSKRTKAEQAAEPSQPTRGKGKAHGKAAKAKPAPQPVKWLDRNCNAALNMQRIGESKWRPLELCYWPEQTALPAKGKEYPGLGYKRLLQQAERTLLLELHQLGRAAQQVPTMLVRMSTCSRLPAPPKKSPVLPSRVAALSPSRMPCRFVCYASTSAVTSRIVEKPVELELLALPPMEHPVDDVSLANPLKRAERLSTSWFGVIMEWEGVLVQDTFEVHSQAWLKVAAEFGFPRPLGHLFRRFKGCRDDLVVSRILKWTQNPTETKQIARRKQAVYEELMGGRHPAEILEARQFLETLQRYNIPIALACSLPGARVREDLKRYNLAQFFDAVVTAEDSGAPEVEYYYSYAAQLIGRPSMRCVVVGESNTSVEAAHELGMKSVIVTGCKPVFDFVSADLVVRNMSQITLFNMKRLFSVENACPPRSLEEDGEEDSSEVDDPELDMFEPYALPAEGTARRTAHRVMAKKKHIKDPGKKQKERFVKLYAKAARAQLGWSGEEAQLFIKMACGYGINAQSSELMAATLDKGHVADLIEEANKHRRLLGMVGVHFIKVDSRVLHGVCKQLGLTKESRAAFTSEPALSQHWARLFDTKKLRNKEFAFKRLVDTDGVSVCVHYTRPLPPPPGPPSAASSSSTNSRPSAAAAAAHAVGLPHIGIAETREYLFDPDTQIGVGIDPGVTQAVSAASGVWDPQSGQLMADQLRRWKLTKGQVKHDSGLNNAHRDTERWLAPIKPHLQHLAAASLAGTSLEANLKHITVTLATWDSVWEVYLDPKWARQRLRLYGAQDRALEQFFNKLEEDMAEVSMKRHGCAKQLVVFFGAATIGTGGDWGADAVLRACRKVVCRPRGTDQWRGRVVLVDEPGCTSRVSSAVNGKQPCEEELDKLSATRPAGWKPRAGQVEPRLVRPAWSQKGAQPVRGLMWCPVVPPRKPPQAPRSSQEATQPAASKPGPNTPPPAKRSKPAAEPTKGKAEGKAAKAKPAPQPGRWVDRDCNAALNMQCIGESRWRPLELCYWPEQGALPAKGKEYPGLGYKRLRDKPPKAQENSSSLLRHSSVCPHSRAVISLHLEHAGHANSTS
ncbi:hypothetical protein QJQ45_017786 [Haematococcus lacustris]|nr:hypothetical protein QJQ45_017786 [Haematococcus lacustris]